MKKARVKPQKDCLHTEMFNYYNTRGNENVSYGHSDVFISTNMFYPHNTFTRLQNRQVNRHHQHWTCFGMQPYESTPMEAQAGHSTQWHSYRLDDSFERKRSLRLVTSTK